MSRRPGISPLAVVAAVAVAVGFAVARGGEPATGERPRQASTTRPVGEEHVARVAVIGGMFETGFYDALAERYERQTGRRVQLITAGPKDHLDKAFKERGGIDVITMHACDAIINLVADGYATDPRPWMKNDLVIVGPPADPAGVRGMTDAAAALRKIADAKAPFVVHSSIGGQEVLRAILDRERITLNPASLTILFADNQRSVLKVAAEKGAYTLLGRIPFRSGKLPSGGQVLMVSGDERLRRPYVVALADPARFPDTRVAAARRFAAYLLDPSTQAWIAEFGRGKLDDQPLFFPIARATTTKNEPKSSP